MSPMAPVKSNSPDYHSPKTSSFLRGLAALGKSTSSERNGAGATKTRARARARIGAECTANGRASERRSFATTICRSFVLAKEENRRSPAGREPIEKGRGRGDRASASAAARFRWHRSRLFIPPPTPLTPSPLPAKVELSLCLSPCPVPSSLYPFYPLSRSTRACDSLRARQDGRQGSAVIFGAENPSTSNSRVSKSFCVVRTTIVAGKLEGTSRLARGR